MSSDGGYNAPDSDRFDGFEDNHSSSNKGGGYQTSRNGSKVSSPMGDSGNVSGGGGWADWDDDNNKGNGVSSGNS